LEKIKNYFILNFSGYSMYPFLRPGDRIIVKRIPSRLFQLGDIVVVYTSQEHFVIHRLVKLLPNGKGIIKGDSLLAPDPEPVILSTLSGKVVAIVRKGRFILMSTGLGSRMKKIYAFLSLKGLTPGAIRFKAKNVLFKMFPLRKSNSHQKEWRFIVSRLGNHSQRKSLDINWTRVKEIASREGVIGILYKQLKDSEIPDADLSAFRDYYQSVAAQNVVNLTALEKLECVLGNENIEVMTLKGASLLNNVYYYIGMRPMGDLDLMIRPEEKERFVILLKKMGYEEDPLLSHFFKKDRVVIDLHIHALNTDRIANREALFPAGMDPIWTNSVPWSEGYQWLRRPDDMDNVLLLSQHLMKHSFSKLIWLVDILKLIKNDDFMSLTDLLKRADFLRQRRPLSYTIYLLNKIFYHKTAAQNLTSLERGILEARADGHSIDLIGPLMAMFCVNGFRKKVAFGFESLFPANEIVKQEVSNAFSGKGILYYPRRFLKIAAPLLRRFHMILGHLIREMK
jgi:signal peptidase I